MKRYHFEKTFMLELILVVDRRTTIIITIYISISITVPAFNNL